MTEDGLSGNGGFGRLLGIMGVLLILLCGVSLLTGAGGLGLPQRARWLILSEVRLPRTLLGLLIGGALGLAGAALQGYLRNPLAEPGIIGISGGAGLGAVVAIHLGLTQALPLALPLAGMSGAVLATFLVLLLAGERGGALTLILAGVAIANVAAALISLALSLSANPFAAVEIVFWLLGSLTDRSMVHVAIAAPAILLGIGILLRLGPGLDALSLGEDVAASLGIDMRRLRHVLILGTALAVGAATAVAGTIGFVGLIVPHVLRPLVGARPSRLLVASLFGGAVLVLAADIAVRLLAPGGELRLGVLTAILGTPLFVWLVLKTRRELAP